MMSPDFPTTILPPTPDVPADALRAVRGDYERYAAQGPPVPLETYIAERYRVDLAAEYAGLPLRNPWGKASGQLSMTAHQVQEDAEAGLGFVVLKTVIAQEESGAQSMQAWAVKESRMVVEPITGRTGARGWTVTWKGRGWWRSFDDYLQLVRDARALAADRGTLIVPSCKYHLPSPGESQWRTDEYEHTTRRLLDAWRAGGDAAVPMPLEKDFSPTLAGSDRAAVGGLILDWLRTVPRLIREAACSRGEGDETVSLVLRHGSQFGAGATGSASVRAAGATGSASVRADGRGTEDTGRASGTRKPSIDRPLVRVGLKLFNALFDDEFQWEMLRAIAEPGNGRPDFYIYANRLFDPRRVFEGHTGVAYGGPDLSDRNLRVMRRFVAEREPARPPLPWSATGNITTGKMALEYALLGAGSFQLHTFFQLPADQYAMKHGSRAQRALHELLFHPETGFLVWMLHLARQLRPGFRPLHDALAFRDIIGRAEAGVFSPGRGAGR